MVGIFSKKSNGINAYERSEARRTTYIKRNRIEHTYSLIYMSVRVRLALAAVSSANLRFPCSCLCLQKSATTFN